MAMTRRQVVTGFSVLYLLGLTILAAYALRSSHLYSLPIPDVVSACVVALPPLAGVALETVISLNEKLAAKGQLQTSRVFQVTVGFFLVFEAVLATLAGTHISPPGSLTCALGETWQNLFKRKEVERIKRIQDTFSCCGFNSPRDMAFPFPDANHGSDACVVRYEREGACFEPWRLEETKVAIMLLVVPVAVFVWKVAIVLAPSSQSSWLSSHIRLPSDSSARGSAARRRTLPALGYRDEEGQGEEDSLYKAVTDLNNDSRLATHVESNRARSNGVLNDAARWRDNDE
ncbi:hypothetical protein LTR37_016703 [Vermiconidia calcicola]|uniref:Uncharacterized protein n=1 Tax=Vermiconidia calcicola TaxID=1690605 RepID=A0ACC3MMC2_9PEZI|nr:hypothetical protein LTR37_016703 [Vermiconidia calcicola]